MGLSCALGYVGLLAALLVTGCSDGSDSGGGGGSTPAGGTGGTTATGGTGGAGGAAGQAGSGGIGGSGGSSDGGTGGTAGEAGSAGSPDGGAGGSVTDYAPTTVEGLTITFMETGGPSNTWTFASATADLQGVDTFPYTFEKSGANHTIIVFDVQGSDEYDMTWESTTGGSCEESFDGAPGNACTFEVQ